MMSESVDETLDKDEAEEEAEELTNQAIFHCKMVFRLSILWPAFSILSFSFPGA